jgi:hypothetical protein
MDEVSNKVCQALDVLAKKHPDDAGIRLAVELRERLKNYNEQLSSTSDAVVKRQRLKGPLLTTDLIKKPKNPVISL